MRFPASGRGVPYRIVIAPDSFKESLTAAQAAAAIESGLRDVWPDATYLAIPMADGGEGTVAAVAAASGATLVAAEVTGPMGERRIARFAVLAGRETAILEMASASGIEHVAPENRDPMQATTFGTGELILAALDAGVSHCILGIGGSATVDGGAGMLQALGARLLDADGAPIGRGGGALGDLRHIDLSGLDGRLRACCIEVACDVDNPLTGPDGAAATFGPQKGATPEMVFELERNLQNLARVLLADLNIDIAGTRGAGAAGGLGATLMACLQARLRPGVELIAEAVGLEAAIRGADLVFTGEGRVDAQTLRGKTPFGVAAIAKRHGKPVIALAGSVSEGAEGLLLHGVDAIFGILPSLGTREKAFGDAAAKPQRDCTQCCRSVEHGGRIPNGTRRANFDRSAGSPMNYFNYFTEIEHRFQQRRGSLLMLSTLDWALIETWREAGIPLEAVLRGIDDAFDKHDAQRLRSPTRVRRINGLAWAAQAVMQAVEQTREAAIGTAGQTATESGFEADRIQRFLEQNAGVLRSAAAVLPPASQSAVTETAIRLEELAAALSAMPEPLEELDRTLSVLEEKLFAALLTATPESRLVALREQAARELAPYRGKMQAVQIKQVQQQFLQKRLLEAYKLPRLSLFYMPHD